MPVEQREGALLAGKYQLEKRLGEGGMGVVWAAMNNATGRRVAIKMLRDAKTADEHVRRRFKREGRAAAAVHHPNVVEILDVLDLDEDTPAIVMEHLEGESLGQRLRARGQIVLPHLAKIMVPAVGAIGTAHALGVVHRDLKPDNIFIARGHEDVEVVKVLDFGIAKITAEAEPGKSAGLTGTGAMLGTPYYMAPEQLFSDETLDYRCDIWALGVILYECLSGMRPTRGDNFADIVKIIATKAIVPFAEVAPDVPQEVADLVMRMLSFDKEKRPQSLREVRDILKHYTDVMASTFGEPVLKPVKQSRDADASGETPGLRRADVELLLADEPSTGPKTAATLDAPGSALARALASRQIAETQPGVPDTTHALGVGLTTPPQATKKSPAKWYAVGAIAAVAIAGFGARSAITRAAPAPANATTAATESVLPAPAPSPSPDPPPPKAEPTVTQTAPAATTLTPATPPRSTPYPPANARTQPTARATATATATATTIVTSTPTNAGGAPGGLVEKPPF